MREIEVQNIREVAQVQSVREVVEVLGCKCYVPGTDRIVTLPSSFMTVSGYLEMTWWERKRHKRWRIHKRRVLRELHKNSWRA